MLQAAAHLRPRVLLISTNSDLAGAPIHVRTIAENMLGAVDFMAVFGEEGPIVRDFEELGIPTRIDKRMRSAISPIKDLAALFALLKVAHQFQPNIIHAHSTKAGMLARVVGLFLRIPVIYTVHGWGWRGFSGVKAKLIWLIEASLAKLKGSFFIFVSETVRSEAPTRRLPRERYRVIHNGGRDFPVDSEPGDALTLLMPARVCDAKDHETLVRAFEGLSADFRLALCGQETDSPNFLSAVRSWAPNAHERISCLGARADMGELLKKCNVFLLISHFEALPLSVIEAMGARRPIIATDVGGLRELVEDGVSGVLVQPRDVDGLRQAIEKMRNPALRDRFGSASRSRFERSFTIEAMCDETSAFYESILKLWYER